MKLDQFFTPQWATDMLVARYFPDLAARDVVCEPSCGDGRFLMAIPEHVDAFGVEIDPAQAEAAQRNSGRDVIVGDFTRVDLPRRPTVVIGNPPFQVDVIDAFLQRCRDELDYGGRVGLLLPVYVFQTASRVVSYQKHWSIAQDMIPRNLFDGLTCPLMFARFTKAQQTVVSGLFLYAETDALQGMQRDMRRLMLGNHSTAACWRDVVRLALEVCGGRATLSQLYACIEGNRPSSNPWWREKVRQVAGKHFLRVGAGEYALSEAMV